MSKLKEIVTSDVILASYLLANLNEKLLSAHSEKKEATRTVVSALAFEIYSSFNLWPSPALVNLTYSGKLKSLKLFAPIGVIPLPTSRTTAKYLRDRIFAACTQKEVLLLFLNDTETLVPIAADIIKIINQFLAEEEKQSFIGHWHKEYPILPHKKTLPPEKTKKKKNPLLVSYFHHQNLKNQEQTHNKNLNSWEKPSNKHQRISHHSFFSFKEKYLTMQSPFEGVLAQPQLRYRHIIDLFAHAYEDVLADLIRLLKRNRTIVRFLLVLFDHNGDRLLPLTQENLLAVCASVADHEVNIQINRDRLERLYYLCSLSRKFSSEVTVGLREYQHHCAANDTIISFPELLLTYCKNYAEDLDGRGPLPLKTLCAKVLHVSRTRHQIVNTVSVELVDEESALPNGIGDDPAVLNLLSHLVDKPSERQSLGMNI